MALDEPKANDEVFDIDGFQYLVNKDFLQKAQPIRVDFLVHGFKLDCGLDFGAACSSCGTGSCG
jgi:Fe-S cluster assembly iron-binding protein IscA